MSQPAATIDLTSLSARSRRSSVSAIPRPTSGTSRYATPTSTRGRAPTVTPDTNGLKPVHMLRRSRHPNDGAPPTSFHMFPASSTSSESLLPYQHRVKRDLSGTQQQLHIQHLSTQSLSGPQGVCIPGQGNPEGNLMGHARTLPKSKTMSSLLSCPRDMTPGRRLLQPLGPPLPRTQTLGNMSCFGASKLTPSPRKPTSIAVTSLHGHDDTSKINVADALLESRMTEKEVHMMKQVQREAAINRARLRSSMGNSSGTAKSKFDHCQKPEYLASIGTERTAMIKVPVTDVANSRRGGGNQKDSPRRRLLFINPTIANIDRPDSGPPTSTTLTSTTDSDQSEGSRDHMKQVYSAETPQYWAGRYTSLCDRFRTNKMHNVQRPSPSDASNRENALLFDSYDRSRMSAALNELRQMCRSTEAMKSFEDFESQLLGNLGLSRRNLYRAANHAPRSVEMKVPDSAGLKPTMGWNAPQSPRNTSTTISRISNVNAEAVISRGPKSFYGDGGLVKSKTTGNLASLIPTISKKQPVPASISAPKVNRTAIASHKRRTSYFECSPEAVQEAMRDREDRAARRAADAYRRSTPRLACYGLPKSDSQTRLLSSRIAVQPEDDRCESRIAQAKAFDPVVGSLDCAMLESGHGLPPPPASDTGSPQVQLVKVPGGGREKLVKSRRKTDRQLSGEAVRNFLGAGMREVKKMGRRVGGWGGSSEDLLLPE